MHFTFHTNVDVVIKISTSKRIPSICAHDWTDVRADRSCTTYVRTFSCSYRNDIIVVRTTYVFFREVPGHARHNDAGRRPGTCTRRQWEWLVAPRFLGAVGPA